MKKIISISLICVLLILGSIGTAMADEISPRYNVVSRVSCGIYPENESIAYDVFLYVPSVDAIDYAYVDIEVRTTSGRLVAQQNGKRMEQENIVFIYEGTTDITTSGTYFYNYEIRCYKDGVMVDNPTGTSRTLVYTP